MAGSVTISGRSNGMLPGMPFEAIKKSVLGESYLLSIAIVDAKESKRLNRIYRGKNVPTDILSFPLDKHEGEIVFNLETVKKEAKKFGRSFDNFIIFLFIHGLVHLKGLDHGKKMEEEEMRVRKKFNI